MLFARSLVDVLAVCAFEWERERTNGALWFQSWHHCIHTHIHTAHHHHPNTSHFSADLSSRVVHFPRHTNKKQEEVIREFIFNVGTCVVFILCISHYTDAVFTCTNIRRCYCLALWFASPTTVQADLEQQIHIIFIANVHKNGCFSLFHPISMANTRNQPPTLGRFVETSLEIYLHKLLAVWNMAPCMWDGEKKKNVLFVLFHSIRIGCIWWWWWRWWCAYVSLKGQ